MCFCDGYSFVVINTITGEKHFIEGDETLCEFFGGRYALPHLFHRVLKKEYVRLNDTLYQLCYNSHPECQRVKMQLVKGLGIEKTKEFLEKNTEFLKTRNFENLRNIFKNTEFLKRTQFI